MYRVTGSGLLCLLSMVLWPLYGRAETIEVSLADASPYVQQTVMYTVRVIGRQNLASMRVTLPSFNHMIVQSIEAPRQPYTRRSGGVTYTVNEFRYAITFLEAGQLTIPPAKVSITKKSWRHYYGQSYPNTQAFQFTTKPIQLMVKPAPHIKGIWRPLYGLRIQAKLLGEPRLQEGEPVRYEVTTKAVGAMAEDIPSFTEMTQTTAFKLYVEQQTLVNRVSHNEKTIEGVRTEMLTLIPQISGKVALPSAVLDWWNIKYERPEQARMLSERIQVQVGQHRPAVTPVLSIHPGMHSLGELFLSLVIILSTLGGGILLLWLLAGRPSGMTIHRYFGRGVLCVHGWIGASVSPVGQHVHRLSGHLNWGQNPDKRYHPTPVRVWIQTTVIRRIEKRLPETWQTKRFFQRLAYEHDAQRVFRLLLAFSVQTLQLPPNTPLQPIGKTLCQRYGVSTTAVSALFAELEHALYAQQAFPAQQWHLHLQRVMKPLVLQKKSPAQDLTRLPSLNPKI